MSREVFHGSDDLPRLRTELLSSPERDRHNRIISYSGVSCSGKDYLLDQTFQNSEIEDSLARISMGTLLSEYHSLNRDKLSEKLDIKQNYHSMLAVIPNILDRAPVVLNNHLVPRYNGMLLFNPDFEEQVNPAYYVVVTADPERIKDWRIKRNKSSNRKTDVQNVDQINLHQQFILKTAEVLAETKGAQTVVVDNSPSKTKENVATLRDIFTYIKS